MDKKKIIFSSMICSIFFGSSLSAFAATATPTFAGKYTRGVGNVSV